VGAEIRRLWRQAGEAVRDGLPGALPDGTKRGTVIGVPPARLLAARG
jgi:hypothetical protein